MANYDARLKYIKDTDLFFADGTSLGTTATWVSDVLDLGAAQVFLDVPAHIQWEVSAEFSLPSNASSGAGGGSSWGQGMRAFMELMDSADGSTWAGSIGAWPMFDPVSVVTSVSIVTVAAFNLLTPGIGKIQRYSMLRMRCATASDVTIKAWMRLGLTK